ncbi:MAG: hypothetical protein ACK5AZ_13610 [Bryobacteraceae bacterium]
MITIVEQGDQQLNREMYYVTFRTRVAPIDGQAGQFQVRGDAIAARRKTGDSGDETASADLGEIDYVSDVTFTGEASFQESGSIRFGNAGSIRFSTLQDGVMTPSAVPGQFHGAVIWRIEGGSGRFENATGLITSNFLFDPAAGEGSEEQIGIVFTA